MTTFDFDLALDDPDYPGLTIAGHFLSVERYLNLLPTFLPLMQNQAGFRLKAELRQRFPGHSPGHLAFVEEYESIEWVCNNLVPRFFLASFVMAAWAAFEIASVEIATYVRKKENARLRFGDLRLADGWDKLQLYLETCWQTKIAVPAEDARRVEALQVVRNLFAHANGSLGFERSTERRAQVQELVRANVGVALHEDDDVLISDDFLRKCFGSLETAVNVLIREIDTRYGVAPKTV